MKTLRPTLLIIFLSSFAILFAACTSPVENNNDDELRSSPSFLQTRDVLPFKIELSRLDTNDVTVAISGLSGRNKIQGMDIAVTTSDGVKVKDIKLEAGLVQSGWMMVKNLENRPVLASAIGLKEMPGAGIVYTVELEQLPISNEQLAIRNEGGEIKIVVSLIENEKKYKRTLSINLQ